MAFEVEYFDQRLLDEIKAWPVDIYADYLRLLKLVAEYGPMLRLPHSRALGDGLFELRPKVEAALEELSIVMLSDAASLSSMPLLKRLKRRPTEN